MFRLPRKILFVISFGLVLIIFSNLFPSNANAASDQSALQIYKPTIDSLNSDIKNLENQAKNGQTPVAYPLVEGYQSYVKWWSFGKMLGCLDIEECPNQKNALGTVTQFIGMLYTHPPASGILYTYDILQNAGLAKPAYAQGIGFAGLTPLLPLWKTARNIAYAVIILFMVAIGLMIIFRMKIDPKTVISLQAAIPKIVITLILITLSYPIVGFMVDLMYLFMAILISILVNGMGIPKTPSEVQTYFMTADLGDLFKTVFSAGFSSFNDFFLPGLSDGGIYGVNITTGISTLFLMFKDFFARRLWYPFLGAASPDIIFLVILLLGLLFTFIRLALLLLNSYIQLLIGLVLAPLQLLFEAIPGRSAFSEWILNIIANLVVYPTTVVVLMFGEYLTQLNESTPVLAPPLTWVPGKNAFSAFLGLGVIFLAPQLVAQVKKMFHPKPIIPISAGTAFAPLTGATQTAMGAASQFYYFSQTASMIPGLKNLIPGAGGGHGAQRTG